MAQKRRRSPTKALPLELTTEQGLCESQPVLDRTPHFNQQPQLQPFEKIFCCRLIYGNSKSKGIFPLRWETLTQRRGRLCTPHFNQFPTI